MKYLLLTLTLLFAASATSFAQVTRRPLGQTTTNTSTQGDPDDETMPPPMSSSTRDRIRAAILARRNGTPTPPAGTTEDEPMDNPTEEPMDDEMSWDEEGDFYTYLDAAFLALEDEDLETLQAEVDNAYDAADPDDVLQMAILFDLYALLADEYLLEEDLDMADEAFASAQDVESDYFEGGDRTSAEDYQFMLDAGHVYFDYGVYDLALERFAGSFRIKPDDADREDVAEAAYRTAAIYSLDDNARLALQWLEYALKAGILDLTDEEDLPFYDPAVDEAFEGLWDTGEFADLRDNYGF